MKKILTILFILSGFVASAQTIPGYTLINSRYKWLAGLFDALGMPAGGNAAFTSGQHQRAGSVYYDSTGSDAGFYIWTGTAWVLQGTPAAAELPDELLSGGQVTYSGTGLKFYISPAVYRISGVIYGTTYDSVTLATADPDDPRKDVIYLATTGVEVKTGTPAGPAAEPQMDIGEIKLTVIDIQAAATTPSLTTNVIYDENTGESVITNVGTTTDPDNTTNVYHLTKSINVTSINSGDHIIITLPSTINLAAFESISLFIKPKPGLSANLGISFYNGSQVVSSAVLLGYTRTNTSYHGVSLPLSRFTFSNTFVDKIIIQASAASVAQAGFYLDYITLVSGFSQPGGSGAPMTVGAIGSKIPSPNGAVIENNVFYQQPASQSYSGLFHFLDKTKLDSMRWKYFLVNLNATYHQLATQTNDSTAGLMGLKDSTGIGIVNRGTYYSIYNTGGLNPGIDDVLSINQQLITSHVIDGNNHSIAFDTMALRFGSYGKGDITGTVTKLAGFDIDGNLLDVDPGSLPGGYTDADARAAISLTTTGTSGAATYNSGTGVLNVPDYSGGAAIWSGTVLGTTFSATTSTVNNGAVQWTFTGSSPTTFTLPARTSSVNQFYTFKNLGSATLTIAAAGSDDIFTTSSVTSVAILPGESIMITGAANGTSDLWTALFHTGIANLLVDSTDTDGPATVFASGDTLRARTMVGTGGIAVNLSATGGYEIDGSGISGGANAALSNLASVAINTSLVSDANNTDDLGSDPISWKDIYTRTVKFDGATSGTTTLQAPAVAGSAVITLPSGTGSLPLLGGTQTFSGGNTFSSTLTASGVFQTAGTLAQSNFVAQSATASTTAQAELQLEGASTTAYRTLSRGSLNYTMVASNAYASHIMGQMAVTEPASGSIPLVAGMALRAPVVTNAAGATAEMATLYIDAAPSGVTPTGATSAIWVKSGNALLTNGNISLGTAGNKLNIATGSNASVGTSTLVGGTVTVSTTAVTASSKIFLTVGVTGGTQGFLSVGTITAGTSFVINSSSGTETSDVNWLIIN